MTADPLDILFRPFDVEAAHAAAVARGAKCRACPLYGCRRGPVLGDVVRDARLAIVGEAPGAREVSEGRVFVGPSGRVLDEALVAGGLARSDTTVTNVLACQPPPGEDLQFYLWRLAREHKAAEKEARKSRALDPIFVTPLECCAPRLDRDLVESRSTVFLAVGGTALASLAGKLGVEAQGIAKQHGAPIPIDRLGRGVTLCSSLHPAFALRPDGRKMLGVVKADIERAARIAVRDGEIDWHEPEFLLRPSADEVVAWLEAAKRVASSSNPLTVDIETNSRSPYDARVRCVGLGVRLEGETFSESPESVICVPFRLLDGRPYWKREADKLRVANALRDALDARPLAGHNLAYDTTVLLRVGLMTDRSKTWFDTMIAHHDTDQSELPHDLGFVAARFFEAPRWKEDADEKDGGTVSDDDLFVYNARDVLNTMRLVPVLRSRVARTGQSAAFEVDTRLAPIARDMGALGLVYDHDERLRHFWEQDAKARKLRAALVVAVGREGFNPASVYQLRDWLYGELKLTPPYSTDGRDWAKVPKDKDGTPLVDPSTNEAAIQALIDGGLPGEIETALETLLKWRAVEKLKGTYCQLREATSAAEVAKARGVGDRVYDVVSPDGRRTSLIDASQVAWEEIDGAEYPVLHTTWKIWVTPTGRWSSAPAVQNWPERPVNMRSMVRAAPGHVLVGADSDQIELRLCVLRSGDALLWDALRAKKDVHVLNYATMEAARAKTSYEGIYKTLMDAGGKKNPKVAHLRNIAKRFYYLAVYGGECEKLFKVMSTERLPDGSRAFPGLTLADVTIWFESFHRLHPEVRRWQAAVVAGWRQHGFASALVDGRKRFFLGGEDPNAMGNHGIQSSAAAIVNRATLEVAERIPFRGWSSQSGLVLQVHDYLGAQVPIGRAEEATRIIVDAMTCEIDGMPFGAEAKKHAARWSEH